MGNIQAIAQSPYLNIHLGGMSIEFSMLLIAILLGFVQLFLAVQVVTAERGTAWNVGPRDVTPPLKGKLAGRLDRAFANFRETFPFFAAAILMAAILGRHNWSTQIGSELYVAARILYLPLYAFGVTGLRTLVFLLSVVGIGLVLAVLFTP
jgi:uncharacterized MAPEG superfamily protein